MKAIFSSIRNSHDLIFKGLLTVACIAVIVYVFPKQVKFKYEFQKNKPWKHERLLSPFDYPIAKSDTVFQRELAAIEASSKPYFRTNPDIAAAQRDQYRQQFEERWPESELGKPSGGLINRIFNGDSRPDSPVKQRLKQKNLQAGLRILDDIHAQGILKLDDVLENQPPEFEIMLKSGLITQPRELQELNTLAQALEAVRSALAALTVGNEGDSLDAALLQDLLDDNLVPNVFYDLETTQTILDEQLRSNSRFIGKVAKGEAIIDKGNIVNEALFQKLVSLKDEYERQAGGSAEYSLILVGQIVLVSISVVVLLLFLSLFHKDVINENNRMTFVMLLFTLIVIMAAVSLHFEAVDMYALPFCILPIIIRTFFDNRLATFVAIIAIVLIGFLAPNGFEFVYLEVIAAVAAIFSLATLRKRSQMLGTAAIIFCTYSICYFAIAVIQEGDFSTIDWNKLAWFGISAVLTLLVYPLIFVFEKLFGFLSDVTLMELSDTNSSLLRELATHAPGTFQHTLQVANLAEAAALEVGGDPLLVRTGSLYHDIGKMADPAFFIENQASGNNPHDDLDFKESARIIISHVIKGIEMAKKHNLPELIIDFIRSHHGTTKTMYFLQSYKNAHPDETVDEAQFQYPGPAPYSKETAILMMADSVEAASRSLKKHDADTIGALVDNIIQSQADQGQFEHADITFKDISNIKKIFKKMLMNIYHVRIEYPK